MIFSSLLPVFILIALGWCLRRFGVIEAELWRGVEQLGFWVLFPALLFNALANADLRSLTLDAVVFSFTASLVVLFLLLLVVYLLRARLFNLSGASYSTVFQTSSRWNAFIALAVMEKLGGDAGMAVVAIIMAFTIPTLNFINILVVAYTVSENGPNWRGALMKTASNPMIWGALGGIAFNLLVIPIYEPIMLSIELIARAGLGVGLLTVGAGLQIRAIFQPRRELWIGVFAKMILFPCLMLGFGHIFNASSIELTALVLCASIPAAMNGYVVASQMGGDAKLYATTTAAQTLLSLFSIPFFLWLTSLTL